MLTPSAGTHTGDGLCRSPQGSRVMLSNRNYEAYLALPYLLEALALGSGYALRLAFRD